MQRNRPLPDAENTEEVTVEADSDDLDKIITKVEGGILKIFIKSYQSYPTHHSASVGSIAAGGIKQAGLFERTQSHHFNVFFRNA